MPSENYITLFSSTESDYYYYSKMLSYEKSFIYFRYDEEEYAKAFEYVLDNMTFLNDYTFSVDDYTFLLQNINARDPTMSPSDYPSWFWMMFYSKETGTIGFFGYHNLLSEEAVKPYEDFRGFLKAEFPFFEW